ncbi:hypothetical protein SAMN04489760_106143 [Syntrophus gentianae]|uniref:Uncharacterized protein n=1 Tax=Syntrophus gentianae TaxID=43775 RepID=A0A1H7WG40_9BACT|nr:hypothetical protein [Syntrophus gentianae]SEM20483.1 hypothetical protein SAMN04489760_106143 [Syntrophus gentianae]
MISKTIRCSCCGHEGPGEMTGTVFEKDDRDIFPAQGHDPYSGMLYFRCPRCHVVVAIDPTAVLEYNTLNGHPSPLNDDAASATGRAALLPVWGGLFSGLTLFCLFMRLLY